MPGMCRTKPRQVKQAMKRLGIKSEDIDGVEEVIIRTKTKEYVIKEAAVTLMEMQGQKTFQVLGEPEIRPRATTEKKEETKIPEEDIHLVMEQTGRTEEEAIRALKETGGQPAEAILMLMSS